MRERLLDVVGRIPRKAYLMRISDMRNDTENGVGRAGTGVTPAEGTR